MRKADSTSALVKAESQPKKDSKNENAKADARRRSREFAKPCLPIPSREPQPAASWQPRHSGREQRNRGADFGAVLTNPLQGYEKRTRRAGVERTRKINVRSNAYLPPARIRQNGRQQAGVRNGIKTSARHTSRRKISWRDERM